MTAAVHIGTSGWHYKHWLGPFYPEKLPASKYQGSYQESTLDEWAARIEGGSADLRPVENALTLERKIRER